MRFTFVLLCGLLIAGAAVFAENTKCKDQLEKVCPGNGGDSAKLSLCLKDQSKVAQLSPDCRPRRVDIPAIRAKCAAEIKSCPNAENDGQMYMCVRRQINANPAAVSAACKAQMN